jgi:hypothetical protein
MFILQKCTKVLFSGERIKKSDEGLKQRFYADEFPLLRVLSKMLWFQSLDLVLAMSSPCVLF